ncbi:MAG: ABC transporter substrate-binding protein [Peptococcaceae bacterium]|nr:ABC transporter substrate-binding protein [Peptococcaceae bacterium]
MTGKTSRTGKKFQAYLGVAVVVLLLVITLLQGCGPKTVEQSGSGYPLTIVDDLGRQVTISKEPARIISLAPANTEILFALGLGDKVVGVTEFCDYPPEARNKPKIGGFSTPNAELIVAAQPDLVLAAGIHQEFIKQLEDANLTVVAVDPQNLTEVLKKIQLIGRITGAVQEANNLVGDMQRRINKIRAEVQDLPDEQKPTVFFELWPDPLTTGGAKSFLHSLIVTAGGKNIAGSVEKDWVTYNPEVLLAQNPEVIIFTHHGSSKQTVEQVKAREGWEQVAAIKNDRVYSVADQNLIVRPGPRVVDGLEIIAKFIHPEIFE